MRYTVWTPRPKIFATLEAARAAAARYFERTGVVVAVTGG